MSKSLEALSKIKSDHEIILFGFSTCDYEYAKEFDIIEKELLTKTKKEQAFDIIKDKRVQVADLLYCSCLEAYNSGRATVYRLFQEEYELVLGVLYEKETS